MDLHLLSSAMLTIATLSLIVDLYVLLVLARAVYRDSRISEAVEQGLMEFLKEISMRAGTSAYSDLDFDTRQKGSGKPRYGLFHYLRR